MRDFADRVKRLLVGRPVPSRALGETLLPKRIALPVFASDALSSVGYAPDEVLITLAVAGSAATVISPWVALAVIGVLVVVVASYRQLAAATTERCEATGRLTAEQALHLREILGPEQPNRLEG